MNMRLFFSTFVLIFLAELGDKTQLAAMARAAGGDGGKWTVFLAASGALVLSTLLAVLFGSALTRVVPEHYIKTAAGVLFVVFGALILVEVFRPGWLRTAAAPAQPGILSGVALSMAAEFERAASDDYRKLAEAARDPRVRALMEWLAEEESRHQARIGKARREAGSARLERVSADRLPSAEALAHNVAAADQPVLEHAIEHEQATARFYEELSKDSTLPGLRATFAALAEEEWSHRRRLTDMLALRDRATSGDAS